MIPIFEKKKKRFSLALMTQNEKPGWERKPICYGENDHPLALMTLAKTYDRWLFHSMQTAQLLKCQSLTSDRITPLISPALARFYSGQKSWICNGILQR